jgi:hypothetical protein
MRLEQRTSIELEQVLKCVEVTLFCHRLRVEKHLVNIFCRKYTQIRICFLLNTNNAVESYNKIVNYTQFIDKIY